ncbi:hypothetical protein L3X38_013045 [Prunus dulcis]|uniref:Uncharacterized protein n=1 Tax=Prunus dulcis TaxID=3755 RepID=A0AAD4WKH7_PRUDU|nr:hypothetical protein L3X38_013045 [Prunus dulcis]
MGDLNNILTTMEKGWGIPRTEQSLMSFQSFVADCDLIDLGFKGHIQGRRILESGVRWRVGNGEKIQVSRDRWIPIPWSFKTTTRHPNLPRMVHELIDHAPLETRGDQ